MKRIILACCLGFAVRAHAANILLDSSACANAVPANATTAPDVAYQPGVDAYGNPVTPANLPGSAPAIQPPKTITIPLQMNLQNALHLNNSNLYAPDAIIGTIKYQNGQVTFNGQPVSADAQAQIQAACAQNAPSASSAASSDVLSGQHSKNLLMGQ